MANTQNFNTFSGFSVTPMLIGGRLKPGKHVFISLSGTWFGSKEKIERPLHLVKKVDVGKNIAILNFADGTTYRFYL
jgi:hypothetical protein